MQQAGFAKPCQEKMLQQHRLKEKQVPHNSVAGKQTFVFPLLEPRYPVTTTIMSYTVPALTTTSVPTQQRSRANNTVVVPILFSETVLCDFFC